MDQVVCSAIRFDFQVGETVESLIVAGIRHYDLIMHRQIHAIDATYWSRKFREEQGFLDNTGTFLSREEALELAYNAKQVRNKCHPLHKLFSEDLY